VQFDVGDFADLRCVSAPAKGATFAGLQEL
jgi:hypothetical protein